MVSQVGSEAEARGGEELTASVDQQAFSDGWESGDPREGVRFLALAPAFYQLVCRNGGTY